MGFEVQTNPEKNRIIVTLTGFATLDDVKRLEQELLRADDLLPKFRGAHQLLYDISGATIQSQEVVDALRDLATHSPAKSAFALINTSALAARQLDRIFLGIDLHRSRDRHEAETWLDRQAGN